VRFDRLVFSEVSRHFERRRALSRVSLVCGAGEIVGLLGHNGAGKSTLLAIAATLLRPSSGEVRYGDVTSEAGGAAIRAQLGLLGHEAQLYSELTAAENLAFFARLQQLDAVDERVRAGLARAGLADRAGDLVSTFSRGMRQRLALERTLLHAPRLLLLDEPFTGLDQASTAALVSRLADLAAEGAIVLLATHDLVLAERVVTRAVVLMNGRVAAAVDDPGTLRERYERAHAEAS
jgi:heme ABC exporter ATP-binding subunit CcmA